MNNERAKRGIWIVSLLSLVIGGILGIYTYDTLLSFRTLNLVGLVYIVMIGIYVIMVALGARKSAAASSD